MRYIALSLIIVFSVVSGVRAQYSVSEDKNKLVPRELSIPPSPLFDMMGASPAIVAKSAAIRDFKVDWSFRSWRINPNLAIESQPIWEIFYSRKDLNKYREASAFSRMLSTVDVSLGTIVNELNDRRIGGAVKINVYRQKDPLLEKTPFESIQQQFNDEHVVLIENERSLLKQLDSTLAPSQRAAVQQQLKDNDVQLTTFNARRTEAIQQKAKELASNNWNAAFIDLAWGQVYTYSTDSASTLKSIRINRNTGKSLWVNFGFGVGRKGMVTGLVRSSFFRESYSYRIRNISSGEESSISDTISNSIITTGLNFRYGGSVFNFFTEFVHDAKSISKSGQVLDGLAPPDAESEIVPGSATFENLLPNIFAIGGDWRISRNLVLSFGFRALMNDEFKVKQVIPNATIGCMMR
ncbi:MAG: hypothetical protein RLZZ630_1885 [Bacteroidota bacterium]|jgi:hypothetical protein